MCLGDMVQIDEAVPSVRSRQNSECILIVDDDEVNSMLVEQCLKNAGYRPYTANCGVAAFEIMDEHEVDLILLDIVMPEIDGLQVLQTLRTRFSRQQLPIIMLTGCDEADDAVRAFDHGANDYVVKPVPYMKLLAIIETHVDLKRSVLRLEQFSHELENKVKERTKDLEKQIEETREAERELRQARKLEAVGQLAAGVAHEINSPMQFIHDNTEFLDSAFGDLTKLQSKYAEYVEAGRSAGVAKGLLEEVDKVRDDVDLDYLLDEIPVAFAEARDGIDRVTRIVRAMKQFAHPGSGQKQPVDLNQIVESTIVVSSNEWKYVAEVETSLDAHLPGVDGFAQELSQVVLNLIVNAAHAIEAVAGDTGKNRGTISVATNACESGIELRIADTGCGIPTEIAERVFDPFFTTKEVGKGTGQGLAIAYSIIKDKHGGDIAFESDDSGTTFVIRLPLQEEH